MELAMFAWDGRCLPTVEALRTYLRPIQPWATAIVLHHTWSPTVAQWRGATSMRNLQRYYRDDVPWTDEHGRPRRGWSAGPHLFVAPDGLWVGTPLGQSGVHAGAWNARAIGVEIVGNYDRQAWPDPTRQQVLSTLAALADWLHLIISRDTLAGHRETGSPKTCPGAAIDMDRVRQWVAEARGRTLTRMVVRSPDGFAAVREAPDIRAPIALNGTAHLSSNTVVLVDTRTGDWWHLAPESPTKDLGFVHQSLLVPAP